MSNAHELVGVAHSHGGEFADAPAAKTLKRLAAEPWAPFLSSQDPRFSDLLRDLRTEPLSELIDSVLLNWDSVEAQTTAITLVARDKSLRQRVGEIEELSIEDLLRDLLHRFTHASGRRLDALVARFGWAGAPPTTLEEAGQLIGVTRERIRQLESKARGRFPTHPVFAPALSKAIATLRNAAPISVADAPATLRKRALTKTNFSPDSVIAAAHDLGLTEDLRIEQSRGARFVTVGDQGKISQVFALTRRLCGASGVCSISHILEHLVDELPSEEKQAPTPADPSGTDEELTAESRGEIRRLLAGSATIAALGNDWYWMPNLPRGRNRLENAARRMLCVSNHISVKRIRDGLRRQFTFRNLSGYLGVHLYVPPSDVLRSFFRAHPDFRIDDNDNVSAATPLDYRAELGELEQSILEIFRTTPNLLLDRQSIRSEAKRRGINPHSLEVALTYSPVVEHLDLNIWTLRGTVVSSAALDAIREANSLRPKDRRLQDFGWTESGRVWISARVPESTSTFVLGAPGPIRRFITSQKFAAIGDDGTSVGQLGVTQDGTIYGFGAYLRRAGAEDGDTVIAEFDLTSSTAYLRLGGDEAISAMESTALDVSDD